jgi:tetratricopeptide (TPR) repeat protein
MRIFTCVYAFKRDLDCAMADFNLEIKLKPHMLAYINRGNVYRDTEQLDGAAADYGEALQYDPMDAYSWNNRAQAKMRLGDRRARSPISERRWNCGQTCGRRKMVCRSSARDESTLRLLLYWASAGSFSSSANRHSRRAFR